jgi:hypothetical protein
MKITATWNNPWHQSKFQDVAVQVISYTNGPEH